MPEPEECFPFNRPTGSDASMFIQWKGTDLCIDFHCPCGGGGHFDGYFASALQCPDCDRVFDMGCQVIAKERRPGAPHMADPDFYEHEPKVLKP